MVSKHLWHMAPSTTARKWLRSGAKCAPRTVITPKKVAQFPREKERPGIDGYVEASNATEALTCGLLDEHADESPAY